jgi:hypothetical protein
MWWKVCRRSWHNPSRETHRVAEKRNRLARTSLSRCYSLRRLGLNTLDVAHDFLILLTNLFDCCVLALKHITQRISMYTPHHRPHAVATPKPPGGKPFHTCVASYGAFIPWGLTNRGRACMSSGNSWSYEACADLSEPRSCSLATRRVNPKAAYNPAIQGVYETGREEASTCERL